MRSANGNAAAHSFIEYLKEENIFLRDELRQTRIFVANVFSSSSQFYQDIARSQHATSKIDDLVVAARKTAFTSQPSEHLTSPNVNPTVTNSMQNAQNTTAIDELLTDNLISSKSPIVPSDCNTPKDFGWKLAKNTGRSREERDWDTSLLIRNSFQGLSVEETSTEHDEDANQLDHSNVTVRRQNSTNYKQNRRPAVVVNKFPEKETSTTYKTVPGNSAYSDVARQGKKLVLYGDSHFNRVKGNTFKNRISNVRTIVRPFTGAYSYYMAPLITPSLSDELPDAVALMSGCNDVVNRRGKPERT